MLSKRRHALGIREPLDTSGCPASFTGSSEKGQRLAEHEMPPLSMASTSGTKSAHVEAREVSKYANMCTYKCIHKHSFRTDDFNLQNFEEAFLTQDLSVICLRLPHDACVEELENASDEQSAIADGWWHQEMSQSQFCNVTTRLEAAKTTADHSKPSTRLALSNP